MKKFLSVLALSSALVLTGCGDTDTPEDDGVEDEATEEPAEDTEDTTSEDENEEVVAGDLEDGSYRIEDKNFGETGWKEALEIVVDGGEITDATWESVDEDGNDKIDDEDYQETMENTDDIGPQDFIPALEDSLVDEQDPSDVEVVSGATHTSEKFQDYAQQLVDAAKDGDTDTIEIDNED